jgi:hypothetical protein
MENHQQTLLAIAPEFEPLRVACIRAAESARRCIKETCTLDELDECRTTCADTATVLEALIELLERPYAPARAVSLRRMIEAGLATTVECAAHCNMHDDDDVIACARCAADCDTVADGLRALLRDLVDDDVAVRSHAT